MPIEAIILFFLYYLSLYAVLYKFCSLPPKNAVKYTIITTAVAFYVTAVHCFTSIILCFLNKTVFKTDYCTLNTPFQNIVLAHSIGYYLADSIGSNYFGLGDINLNLHHFCVIVGFFGRLYDGYGSSEVIEALMYAEITSPLYIARNLYETFYLDHTKKATINNIVFFFSFVVIRSYIANKLMYDAIKCHNTTILFSMFLGVITVVGSYWMFTMISIAFNTIFGKEGGKWKNKVRTTLKFLSRSYIGKNIFPCFILGIALKAVQAKYNTPA